MQLQSGPPTIIDNVGTNDIGIIEGDANLQLVPRDPLNVFYIGFNVDMEPFNDPGAPSVAIGIDRQRSIDTFYPTGSSAATQFLPPSIPGYEESFVDFEYDPEAAGQMIAEAYPDGLEVDLSYRHAARGYLPQPTEIATDIQAQLGEIGINVNLDLQESTTLIDNVNSRRQVPFYLLGWGTDFPDPSNFPSTTTSARPRSSPAPASRTSTRPSPTAGATRPGDTPRRLPGGQPAARRAHPDGADRLRRLGDGLPGGSAGRPRQPVDQRDPVGDVRRGPEQLVLVQNGEPGGLAARTRPTAKPCVSASRSPSRCSPTRSAAPPVPSLAESWESNEDYTVWTFHLRPGVTFHDGSEFDAADVVESYRVPVGRRRPAARRPHRRLRVLGRLFGGFPQPTACRGRDISNVETGTRPSGPPG